MLSLLLVVNKTIEYNIRNPQNSNSTEKSLDSKYFENENFKNKSDDDFAFKNMFHNVNDGEHHKSAYLDNHNHDESTKNLHHEKAIRVDQLDRDESPVRRLAPKEILKKKTGRFEESVYESANNAKFDIQNPGYIEDNESGISSPHEIHYNANNKNFKRNDNAIEVVNTKEMYNIGKQDLQGQEQMANINLMKKRFNPNITQSESPDKNTERRKLKAPTLTIKDSNRLDLFGLRNLNDIEDDDAEYPQQYIQKSDRNTGNPNEYEEDKGSLGIEDGTQINSREMPRIRGGAVTQGFMVNDRRRKEQRRSNREFTEQQEKQNQEQQMQSPYHQNVPSHGRYDNMYRAAPMPSHQAYDIPNDMYVPKEDQNMNIVPYGYNNQADPRQNEQLRAMSEMMNTMFAYQSKNFKSLMDSHTQLMSKLIDKKFANKDKN